MIDRAVIANRALPAASSSLDGAVASKLGLRSVAWHVDSGARDPAGPAVAWVASSDAELVGQTIALSVQGRRVVLYTVAERDLSDGVQVSIPRRAFMALGRLAADTITVTVEVIA